jgi:hypothetical protein
LPNPTNCEYRTVTIVARDNLWDAPEARTTNAWVLPNRRGAIAWNGVVYAPTSIGGLADLRSDVVAAIAPVAAVPVRERRDLSLIGVTIGPAQFAPLHAALLLRSGEGALAIFVWQAWLLGADRRDPFAVMASDWLRARVAHAVDLHASGEDAGALDELRGLPAASRSIEAELSERGVDKEIIEFVDHAVPLLIDQERRAKRTKHPQAPSRVARLIDELDQLTRGQGIDALVDEGDRAVEALLECLEHDDRLTRRSSGFSTMLPVYRVALAALVKIMQTEAPTDVELDGETRSRVAAQLRSFWRKYRGLPLEERWFRQLADDTLSFEDWKAAAKALVAWLPDTDPPRLRGESLRSRNSPSLSELLLRRINSMLVDRPDNAQQLLLDLFEWDPPSAIAPAERWMSGVQPDFAAGLVSELTIARAPHDERALFEHIRWLRTFNSDDSAEQREALRPLWRNPGHYAVAPAVEQLFGDRGSRWARIARDPRSGPELVNTPLLGLNGFRSIVLAQLGNRKPIPKDAEHPKVRVCDMYARELSRAEGMPDFDLSWPRRQRDPTIVKMRSLLAQYGERYRWANDEFRRHSLEDARLAFSVPGRAATEADVQRGDALFALPGGAKRREMPEYPLFAVARTPTGKEDGWVWQAETDANGDLYYGFVGPNEIRRVPAAEIEFPYAEHTTPLTRQLECIVEATTSGQVSIDLRNRAGDEQQVAASSNGLRIVIERVDGATTQIVADIPLPMLAETRVLGPAAAWRLAEIVPRDLSPPIPGSRYRLQVHLNSRDGAPAEGLSNEFWF